MRLQVKVKPGARASVLEQLADGTWLAQLRAQPVDGAANRELIALFASHFAVPKSAVSIRGGASGRMKWIEIEN
jgi:uncharacterized protein YggU (UPF0235/DUF167 family)